ncbi:Similar to tmem242: Transmembrane protein 242 (Danio rerio) [Cotesia congregata]|uniref:Transmembrane protein 242 n=1 Tax=Cotesia congregata TaxID=51543 RepID=A0A8J2MRY9_COTCN|nr:Similar to tmem242: Transmembrane protein 242 (Danio rerio) [Cotesia congregata]
MAASNKISSDQNFNMDNEFNKLSVKNDSGLSNNNKFYGFGTAVAGMRKQDPKYFQEGVVGVKGASEAGVSLAMRALGIGTVYAVTGCGLLFYGIWKLSGATNALEFRQKMGSFLPQIPKNNPPKSRTEFEGLNDLLKYVSEEWGKESTRFSFQIFMIANTRCLLFSWRTLFNMKYFL